MKEAAVHPLIERFARAGQAQVFVFWDQLDDMERRSLLEQAGKVDLAEIARLTRSLLAKNAPPNVNLEGLSPAPYERLPENGGDDAAWARAKTAGEKALRAGKVAAFTVAGGQGTRLELRRAEGHLS